MTWLTGGHDNWFSISLEDPSFQLQFNRRAQTLYSEFTQAADVAVRLLYQDWKHRPLYLAMSGGIDSEFVADTLYRNNIPFIPIILKIENFNCHESWYADYWCYQHHVQPVVLEYSMPMFLDAMVRFFPMLTKIKQNAQTPMLIIYDWVTQQNGHCIYGAGDINLKENQFYCSCLDFISNIIYQDRHPTSFFMYTAELALSYISKFDIALDEQYNKLSFYGVSPRPKIDYISSFDNNADFIALRSKLCYVCKYPNNYNTYHWYGTQQQIIQNLQP